MEILYNIAQKTGKTDIIKYIENLKALREKIEKRFTEIEKKVGVEVVEEETVEAH